MKPSETHKLAGQKVVIIGGAGFIGHNMALKMKSEGIDVSVIDSLGVNNYYAIERERYTNPNGEVYLNFIKQRMNLLHQARIPFIELDARDYHGLSEAMEDLAPDAIVHLAAVAHANRSNKDPYSTFDHSLRTLENALDVARSARLNIKRFVYFSSSMVYGTFADASVNEETACNPMGIYGALKFAGEKMVVAYNQVFDLPFTIIRPSALYGERCVSRRVGQALIENAMRGNDLTINGDGSDCLDFTYVQDLIGGVIGALASKDADGEIFNLTYGSARSLNQMVDILRDHFPGLVVRHNPRDSLMPERGTLNVDKARRLFGYDPQHPLEKGFVDYINWYKANWDEMNTQTQDAGQVVYLPASCLGVNSGPNMALRPDGWLSEMLGKPAWHLDATGTGPEPTPLPAEGDVFVDVKLPVADIEGVARLQAQGFRLVDTAIQLDRPHHRAQAAPQARPARPEDRLAVERIAEQSFTFSRFHQDPLISKSVADRIKRAWAGNFFDSNRGDHMIVAEVDGEVAGFLQLLQADNLLTIDLIAVSARYRGKGLARAMIDTAEAIIPDITHFRVGTQAANVRSLRSYTANGFQHLSAHHVLHFHG